MRVSNCQLAVVAVLVTLFITQAHAGNMSFLRDAPMGKFTDEDMKLMNANLEATVADTKVRTVHTWSNQQTGYSGTAETLQAFAGPNSVPCKRVRITNRAGTLTGKGQYTLCKLEGKEWTVVPNDYAPAPQPKATSK
jgi:hypothetical protein